MGQDNVKVLKYPSWAPCRSRVVTFAVDNSILQEPFLFAYFLAKVLLQPFTFRCEQRFGEKFKCKLVEILRKPVLSEAEVSVFSVFSVSNFSLGQKVSGTESKNKKSDWGMG